MEKILLDTDIGGDIDDAVCLAYLLKEHQLFRRIPWLDIHKMSQLESLS